MPLDDASSLQNAVDFPASASCWLHFLHDASLPLAEAEARRLLRCSGGGSTHWFDGDAEPRCALEHLARDVILFHTARLDATRNRRVGAEWWVQVRAADESMSIHWDCDEAHKSASQANEHISPYLATVTYLTNIGAPTLVLPIAADACGRAIVAPTIGDDASECSPAAFASFPVRGKHLAFDGRLLHGAPYEGPPIAEGTGEGARVTVLVNLWLDHHPYGVESLEEEIVEALVAESKGCGGDGWRPMLQRQGILDAPVFGLPLPPKDAAAEWREFEINGQTVEGAITIRGIGEGLVRPLEEECHFVRMPRVEVQIRGIETAKKGVG